MNIFNGRINRLSFFVSQVIVSVFSIIYDKYNLWDKGLNIYTIFQYVAVIFSIISITKRFHDMNQSGWRVLTLFIPIYDIYVFLKLLIGAGDFGENKYGKAPTKGVHLFT